MGSLFPWQPPSPKWACRHWIQGWDRAWWIYVTLTECWAFGVKRSWSLDASTPSQSDSFASVVCSWAPQGLLHTWLETYSLQTWNIKKEGTTPNTHLISVKYTHTLYTHTHIYVHTCIYKCTHTCVQEGNRALSWSSAASPWQPLLGCVSFRDSFWVAYPAGLKHNCVS